MITPAQPSSACPVATVPAEVLMLTFDHLDLKDLFVTRFVCKEFHDHAHRALAAHKNQVKRHVLSKADKAKSKLILKNALNEANYFYEKVTVPRPTGFWCKRCFQVKPETDFCDYQRAKPYRTNGRHCWKCKECTEGKRLFLLDGLAFYACAVPGCLTPIPDTTGYWTQRLRSSPSRAAKVCVHCWPTFRRALTPKVRAKYRYYCACEPRTQKCEFVCEEGANDITDAADVKAGRALLL